MSKSTMAKIITFLALVSIIPFLSCRLAGLAEGESGSLRLVVSAPQGAARALGARAIDASVTTVEVKLTSVPSDLYPPRMASAAFVPAGTTVSMNNVKVGTWKVEIFLNDTTGNQLYYGSDQVTITAGTTTSASIAVFKTGGVGVTVTEGVEVPIFTPSAPNMTTKTFPLGISFPASVAQGTTNIIKYTIGTGGTVPSDPSLTIGTSINASLSTPLTMNFTDTIKAVVIMGSDARSSAVVTFSYTRPYFDLAAGSYSGYQNVRLQSMRSSITIRYTVSDTTPGADPTYEYGEIGGINTVVALRNPTSVLKALSYIAGQPDTISDVASATYTLTIHNAPAATLAQGLEVAVAGTDASYNGKYSLVNPSYNSYPVYAKDSSANYYFFYSPYYSRYVLGYSAAWSSYSQAYTDASSSASSHWYLKSSYGPGNPYGRSNPGTSNDASSDAWYYGPPGVSQAQAPWVTRIDGIGGRSSSSTWGFATGNGAYSYFSVGRVMTVYYTYSADAGDAEDLSLTGSTFQWSRQPPAAAMGAIAGATSRTYTLTAQDVVSGTILQVAVTPKSASGTVGSTVYSSVTVP
jgi:hypothetical protein